MRWTVLGAGLICILGVRLSVAQDPAAAKAPSAIPWEADYSKALQKAKAGNKPILVAFLLRGEPANEEICSDHLRDPEIAGLCCKFVCVLSLGGLNGPPPEGAAGSAALIKDLEGRISLTELASLEREARTRILETAEVSTPQFVFLRPDGTSVLTRHVWMLSKAELLDKIQRALHFFDPSSPAPPELAKEAAGLDDVLKRCDDNNLVKRRDAMYELAKFDGPRVVDFLIRQSRPDNDATRRMEAIRAMGQKGQAKFLPVLHALLKETDFQIRVNVAESLRQIGLVESVPVIHKVLVSERKDNVRSLLIRALAGCGLGHEEVLRVLSGLLDKGSDSDKMTVLWVLAGLEPGHALAAGLPKASKSASDKVRAFAFYAAGKQKAVALSADLAKRLASEKQLARKACVWALAELGAPPAGESVEDPSGDLSMLMPTWGW